MTKKNPAMDEHARTVPPKTPHNPPEIGQRAPNANVDSDEHCILPAHPESARLDTGEPCDDGRGDAEKKGNAT